MKRITAAGLRKYIGAKIMKLDKNENPKALGNLLWDEKGFYLRNAVSGLRHPMRINIRTNSIIRITYVDRVGRTLREIPYKVDLRKSRK